MKTQPLRVVVGTRSLSSGRLALTLLAAVALATPVPARAAGTPPSEPLQRVLRAAAVDTVLTPPARWRPAAASFQLALPDENEMDELDAADRERRRAIMGDCNLNGVPDAAELAHHVALDRDGDGGIDECDQGLLTRAWPGSRAALATPPVWTTTEPVPLLATCFEVAPRSLVVLDHRGARIATLPVPLAVAGFIEAHWRPAPGVPDGIYYVALAGGRGWLAASRVLLLR